MKKQQCQDADFAIEAANAKLMAAAPDMLAALKNSAIALRFYEKWMFDNCGGTSTTYPFGKDVEAAINDLIARAEGRTP